MAEHTLNSLREWFSSVEVGEPHRPPPPPARVLLLQCACSC